jgi:hypothetical protein
MNAVPSLDERLAQHEAWWRGRALLVSRSPHPGLGDLWLPLADGTVAQQDMRLRPEMLDLDSLAGPQRGPGALRFVGDVIETDAPYVRVPWVEAILGCPIHATIQGGSMRALKLIDAWDQWPAVDRSQGAVWRATLAALLERMVERAAGQIAITQTLMRGPSDLAEAALGSELMSYSLYDHPEELTSFLEEGARLFIDVLHDQLAGISRIQGGMVNPFGIWAPGTVVRAQCDASAFLSPSQYADWVWPHDAATCEAADYAVIHLHSGSLHVLEPILAAPKPQAVQVSLDPVPSGPPLADLLPAFRRILEAKALIVDGPMEEKDLELLLDKLPHGGLCVLVRQGTW